MATNPWYRDEDDRRPVVVFGNLASSALARFVLEHDSPYRVAAFTVDAAYCHDDSHEGLPLLGICYGHQLLAHALGGEVAYNPAGRESGTVHIDLHPHAQDDPLFSALPLKFTAHATHVQTVARPPEGATVLAVDRPGSAIDTAHAGVERVVPFAQDVAADGARGPVGPPRVALVSRPLRGLLRSCTWPSASGYGARRSCRRRTGWRC